MRRHTESNVKMVKSRRKSSAKTKKQRTTQIQRKHKADSLDSREQKTSATKCESMQKTKADLWEMHLKLSFCLYAALNRFWSIIFVFIDGFWFMQICVARSQPFISCAKQQRPKNWIRAWHRSNRPIRLQSVHKAYLGFAKWELMKMLQQQKWNQIIFETNEVKWFVRSTN